MTAASGRGDCLLFDWSSAKCGDLNALAAAIRDGRLSPSGKGLAMFRAVVEMQLDPSTDGRRVLARVRVVLAAEHFNRQQQI